MSWMIHFVRINGLLFLACAAIAPAPVLADRPPITTGSLFEEMIDLADLSQFPDPAYRTIQFSSYDHRSRLPGGPEWFANADGFGGEPIPNFIKVLREPDAKGIGEYLLAECEGPGAIVRLWTAAISGTVRVTIDGAETPAFEGGADEFFRRPYDRFPQAEKLQMDRFRNTVYQRDASYAPIPFAQSLRVTWTGNVGEIHFYHLQVRLYQAGTQVVSFSPKDLETYRETIDKVTAAMADPDKNLAPNSMQSVSFSEKIAPSEKKTVAKFDGAMAVKQLSIQVTAENLDLALRQTVISITFDEYPWAQVQSPVGDFFGAAPGVNPFESLPFSVKPDGTMICRFVMPFEKSCRIELQNRGQQSVHAKSHVIVLPMEWTDRSMHFRARWRADHNLTASNREVQDLPFLLAQGKGVYVGSTSYLMNPCPVPTPGGNWWGEGDEKVFVDADFEPSIFGTGSEDYYNYSWSSPDIFAYPYCGQPRNDGPGNHGFVTNFRWHILDGIPFQSGIRFYMELFSHERVPGLSYARIGYHYARPGVMDDHQTLTADDLRIPALPDWQPAARGAASNSVFYAAEEIQTENKGTRLLDAKMWAGGKLLVWNPTQENNRKTFNILVSEAGKKQIHVAMAMTDKSGKVAFELDGKPLPPDDNAESIDLNVADRTLLRSFALKPQDLNAGDHTLTILWKGAPASVAEPQVGIDFIWVQKR
ncbi:MAG: DUF2961 domain-containing protein [Phycisphaerae bacterium]|nr:DUF2961 domain-containing protein [Phycisphaerae bacterium]